MPQSEASGRPDAGGPATGRAGGVPPGTAALLKRWSERAEPESGLPGPESRRVLEAVLDDLRGASTESLDVAGRLWGQAHRSVAQMVDRLSHLRVTLASCGVEDPLEMHRAIDRVTAAATEEVMSRLERVSRTDALTGVGNRRAFDETIQGTLSAASRQGHDVTVVAVDLDGLKAINDTEGHAAGDAALIALVRSFYDALRDEDMVFRVGGDEFVIVLPFTSVDAAEALMHRVASANAPQFTWGAAGYPIDGADPGDLVHAADRDLYRRRGMVRERAHARRRVSSPVPRLESATRVGRWAWVPAAAVIAVSLVATLVSATTGGNLLANRHPAKTQAHSPSPATSSGGGSQGSDNPGPGSQAGGPGTAAGSSTSSTGGSGAAGNGTSALAAGFTKTSSSPLTVGTVAAAPTGSGGGAGSGGRGAGSGGGGTGGTPSPPAGSAGNGGLVGSANQLLGPLPIVGDNGILPVLDELLVGQPSTVTATVRALSVKSPSAGSGALSASGTSNSAGVTSSSDPRAASSLQALFQVLAGL